jgi:hypothetical protein
VGLEEARVGGFVLGLSSARISGTDYFLLLVIDTLKFLDWLLV